MTDLLTSPTRGTGAPSASRGRPGGGPDPGGDSDGRRPVVLGAGLAGAAAAGAVLVGCLALGLTAWFATDRGSHGSTREALRLGADAWLLAHGSALDVGIATITLVPWGLTLLCCYVAYRLGRWAGLTSAAEELGSIALAAVVLAAVYGLSCLAVAVLASVPEAEPHLGRAFAGGFVVALAGGGPGLLSGSGRLHGVLALVPRPVRATAYTGLLAPLLVVAAGGVLVTLALLLDLGAAENVLAGLQVDSAGAALYTLIVAGLAPNLALFGASYLVGPGFAVGSGTTVSTSQVVLGPVPAFPPLAALPAEGAAPGWAMAFLAVPVLAGCVAGVLTLRAFPARGYDVAATRGLAGGVFGGLLLGLAMRASGGAVGPGRMQDLGPGLVEPTGAAIAAVGLGALLGAVLAHWRRGGPEHGPGSGALDVAGDPTAADDREATVDLSRDQSREQESGRGPDRDPDGDFDGGADEPTVRL